MPFNQRTGSFNQWLGVETESHIQRVHENMKRTAVLFSLGLFALILVVLLITRSSPDVRKLSQPEFTMLFQSNLLAKVRVYYPPKPGQADGVPVMLHEVRGTFYQTDAHGQILKAQGIPTEFPFIASVQFTDELESKLTRSTNFSFVSPNPLVQQASKWLHLSRQ
ncbi:hypothetical protein SBV1_230025 [Verrucomicrobia bacterium]|nr:hypothetical protein SBV1_230025 [Verrucomicrobiota bacterium]